MSDGLANFRTSIQRFRTGGIAIAALPLLLGFALLLARERVPALQMLSVSVVLYFLIFWAAHCASEAVTGLENQRRDRP